MQISRGLRLCCPVCGRGKLFRGWFTMYDACPHCHFRYERSPGYWLGSIYVNYGLTALIVTGAFFGLFFTEALPEEWIKWLLLVFCLLFPLGFFRYARGIWIAVDVYFDPVPTAKNLTVAIAGETNWRVGLRCFSRLQRKQLPTYASTSSRLSSDSTIGTAAAAGASGMVAFGASRATSAAFRARAFFTSQYM